MGFVLPFFNLGRKSFISPERATQELGIKEGDKIVDYGAGIGFWTEPLSKVVGRGGKVYALTANEDFAALLKKKKEIRGLNNIDVVSFNLEEGDIEIKEQVDLVLMANVLHLIKNKTESFKRAKKLLKNNGRIIIIDFIKKKGIFGPPLPYRISEEEVISYAKQVGLEYKCSIEAGSHHFGLIFIKSNEGGK